VGARPAVGSTPRSSAGGCHSASFGGAIFPPSPPSPPPLPIILPPSAPVVVLRAVLRPQGWRSQLEGAHGQDGGGGGGGGDGGGGGRGPGHIGAGGAAASSAGGSDTAHDGGPSFVRGCHHVRLSCSRGGRCAGGGEPPHAPRLFRPIPPRPRRRSAQARCGLAGRHASRRRRRRQWRTRRTRRWHPGRPIRGQPVPLEAPLALSRQLTVRPPPWSPPVVPQLAPVPPFFLLLAARRPRRRRSSGHLLRARSGSRSQTILSPRLRPCSSRLRRPSGL